MRFSLSTLLLAVVPKVFGDKHYFFSGFFTGNMIAGVEFDDSTNDLTLVNNITVNASEGSKWIAIDVRAQLFSPKPSTSLTPTGTQKECLRRNDRPNPKLRHKIKPQPHIQQQHNPLLLLTGCAAQALAVDSTGALTAATANLTYNSTSGVHGLDISPDAAFVYSADDMGNAVWAHSYDRETKTAQTLQYLAAPEGANPRHLAVHPNGAWVYVIYEEANSLAVYKRDNKTGLLTDEKTTYSLLPAVTHRYPGFTNTSSYWADEVKFSLPTSNSTNTTTSSLTNFITSAQPKYLITGTRSRSTNATGYVSAFALDASTGAITSQLFLLPTTASGGSANAVSPALFGEEYFAITDSGANFVEVWKIEREGMGASAVARLGFESGPANVVWMD
ncbi:hypothetical protein IG631_05602 [Alternaria alternata]|nr:hypothetical protein IG631_05602 [Alternaria alternata]